jgi:outer membrane protein
MGEARADLASQPFGVPVVLVCCLFAGCGLDHAMPLPPELTDAGVRSRLLISEPKPAHVESIMPVRADAEADPDRSVFSLGDAVAYAQRHNPRLRSAKATLGGAKGQEEVAFAAFLPEVGIYGQSGATSRNMGPGTPSVTGFLLTDGVGTHSYAQGLLALQWIVYDFGRRTARHQQAVARQRIAEFHLTRADQTVQFDVAVAYLDILLARASLLVQEDAIRQAESILKDARARFANGVADPDDVLRAEVQLSESRDGLVRAQEAKLVTIAQLNNVMGRNAALPLEVTELGLPPAEARLSLAKSLEIAGELRPEIQFARQGVVAAQEGVMAAKAAYRPNIYVRGATGGVEGNNVLTGWQNGIGLHLEIPLYTGGRLSGGVHEAEAEVSAALADAQVIVDRVSLEVTQAFQAEVAAGQRLELSRTAVVEAQENLRLVRVKYRNGNATPTEIVDAETTLTRSQQRLKSTLYTYLATLARLDYAVGQPQGTILRHGQLPEMTPDIVPTVHSPRPRPKVHHR